MKNISLIGYMGSGKSTVADILVKEHGYTKFSFGSEVKYIAKLILGRDVNKEIEGDRELLQNIGQIFKGVQSDKDIQGWINISSKFKYYYDMNLYNFGRYDYFVQKLMKDNDFQFAFSEGKAVIDDMRFGIEQAHLLKASWQWYQDYNFIQTIKVNSPLELCKLRLLDRDKNFKEEWFENQSEKEFLKLGYDYLLTNSTLSYDGIRRQLKEIDLPQEELKKQIEIMVNKINKE